MHVRFTNLWWQELINRIIEVVCKGLDHEDARAVDPVQAAMQLKAASEFMADQDATKSAPE